MLLRAGVRWAVLADIALAIQKPIVGAEDGREDNPFTSAFKNRTLGLMGKWHVPGMAFAVIDGNNTFFEVC